MNSEFDAAIESFAWESEDQKKGYLALVQYLRQFGLPPKLPIDYVATFFIQKDIDSHEYWRDMVGGQIKALQDDVMRANEAAAQALAKTESLEMAIQAQSAAIQALTRLTDHLTLEK